MGMDGVELVMAVEESFCLEISNAEAEKLFLVADLHALVIRKLRERGEVPDDAQVFARLREIIVDLLGVQPERVIPSARFVKDLGLD
jgi:acyl carrier protein